MSKEGPNKRERTSSPERLTDQEIQKIVEKVNNERLRTDEHGEYFTLHLEDKITSIPKRKYIDVKNEDGIIQKIEIGEYIQNYLKKYDENKNRE